PPPHLQYLVQCFWSLQSSENCATPREYFLMADGCPEIIFQYKEGFQKYSTQSARVRFQHSVYEKFEVGKNVGFFGVRLYPHAICQLLRMPSSEGINRVFDFTMLFKQGGENLADQVYNAKDSYERVALVSGFIAKRALTSKPDPIEYLVKQVIEQAGQVDISSIQQQANLSVKQFERRFKAIAGFTPKYFARIARFQGVRTKYCSGQFENLTGLAYSCNYYDQSHFIREFKEFSGVQPLHYLRFVEKGNTGISKRSKIAPPLNPPQFNGYLPCGLFV
ncbi:MAG: helix-turn-helix domain-containing protein, partial [Mucilaginibacter sp.]